MQSICNLGGRNHAFSWEKISLDTQKAQYYQRFLENSDYQDSDAW